MFAACANAQPSYGKLAANENAATELGIADLRTLAEALLHLIGRHLKWWRAHSDEQLNADILILICHMEANGLSLLGIWDISAASLGASECRSTKLHDLIEERTQRAPPGTAVKMTNELVSSLRYRCKSFKSEMLAEIFNGPDMRQPPAKDTTLLNLAKISALLQHIHIPPLTDCAKLYLMSSTILSHEYITSASFNHIHILCTLPSTTCCCCTKC